MARENQRHEALQLQMAECIQVRGDHWTKETITESPPDIQKKAERKRKENKKLATEIEAERKIMMQMQ